jgi:hypothetical protein
MLGRLRRFVVCGLLLAWVSILAVTGLPRRQAAAAQAAAKGGWPPAPRIDF